MDVSTFLLWHFCSGATAIFTEALLPSKCLDITWEQIFFCRSWYCILSCHRAQNPSASWVKVMKRSKIQGPEKEIIFLGIKCKDGCHHVPMAVVRNYVCPETLEEIIDWPESRNTYPASTVQTQRREEEGMPATSFLTVFTPVYCSVHCRIKTLFDFL